MPRRPPADYQGGSAGAAEDGLGTALADDVAEAEADLPGRFVGTGPGDDDAECVVFARPGGLVRTVRSAPMGGPPCQATVQPAPLRVKEAGLAVLPVWVAWKPMPACWPGLMVPL